MPNTLLTIGDMSRELLMRFKNNLGFTGRVYRGYDDRFAKTGAKIGNVANIRVPQIMIAGTGADITGSINALQDVSVPVTITDQLHVPFQISSSEMTLSIDDVGERYLEGAAVALANQVDLLGLQMAARTAQAIVGTPGTPPSTTAVALDAGVYLDNAMCPRDKNRHLVVNPRANAAFVGGEMKGLFNAQSKIGDQFESGMMAKNTLGFNWFMDQNVKVHTVGPLGGTPLVNGAAQVGSSLVTDGWTAAAALRLNIGDRFTIAGVEKVNMQSKQTTGQLQVFTVTAAVSSSGAGAATIPISPAIVISGPTQNVTGSPADNAVITPYGAANTVTPQNIAFHRNAFTLACVDLESNLAGAEVSRITDSQTGLSIRVARQYAIMSDIQTYRADIMIGWAPLRPEWACVIAG